MSRVVCAGCGRRDCGGWCYHESAADWLERAAPIAKRLNNEARKDRR